jgi:hypothetical protein
MRISATAGLGRFLRLLSPGVLAIAVVGCGGSSSAPSTAASVPAAPASAAGDPSGKPSGPTPDEPVVATVDVGGEAWFAGFHVTFGKATSTIEPNGRGTLTLEATFENTGDESARLDATLTLVSADETARDGFEMDIPRVPGGQTAKGTFAFDVDESFSFDDAVLTLGQPTNQQAIVPLSVKAGMAVSQKPVELNLSGSGKAGSLKLALNGGEIRADSPWKHGQQKKGSLILTVRYDASFESGFAGGFAFTAENVALKLPDGTTVGVIQDGESQSTELIGPNSTKKDLFSRFEIDDPAPGAYVLLVRSFDNAEDEIPFTIG